MDGTSGIAAEARSHATQALAQYAADEEFRKSLSSWKALAPLCAQLSPATQPDARTRAMALSAIANVSFVDASALAEAGGTSRLIAVLFDVIATRSHPGWLAGGGRTVELGALAPRASTSGSEPSEARRFPPFLAVSRPSV